MHATERSARRHKVKLHTSLKAIQLLERASIVEDPRKRPAVSQWLARQLESAIKKLKQTEACELKPKVARL